MSAGTQILRLLRAWRSQDSTEHGPASLVGNGSELPPSQWRDLDPPFLDIMRQCLPATMTSVERLFALYKAIEYLVAAGIPGDIVECGVWRGGSMMCAALSLLRLCDTQRRLYLYDTFEGMPPPDGIDVDAENRPAATLLCEERRSEDSHIWAFAPIEVVRRNIDSTGYPKNLVAYVPGPVERTIPATMPDSIALLRLDTDWYASTQWELKHLFPKLVKGGVLIIDDYGHWKGARRAVDEYFEDSPCKILLNRVDNTGRVGIRF